MQVYWDSVSDFAKQPITVKSEFLKQLPMFSGLSDDLLLFLACIAEYVLLGGLGWGGRGGFELECFYAAIINRGQAPPVAQRPRIYSIRKHRFDYKPSRFVCDEGVSQYESSSCPTGKGR